MIPSLSAKSSVQTQPSCTSPRVSLWFYVRLWGPGFSCHFPAFSRIEFTLPYCPEQEKIFIFDDSFCKQPHYQVTLFVLIICQNSEPLSDSLNVCDLVLQETDTLIYFEGNLFFIAVYTFVGFHSF